MYSSIDIAELAQLLASGGVTLIDVRETDEFAGGHVPEAVNIPMSVLPVRLSEIPTGGVVHLICRTGARSSQVGRWLDQQGYEAVNVEGGTLAWYREGRPLQA